MKHGFLKKFGSVRVETIPPLTLEGLERQIESGEQQKIIKWCKRLHKKAFKKGQPWFLILKKQKTKKRLIVMPLNAFLFDLDFVVRHQLSREVNWTSICIRTKISKKKLKRLRKQDKALKWRLLNNFVLFACSLDRFLELVDKKSFRKQK